MRDKIVVMQDDLKDCGVSSLLSIIRYYGGDATKEYLREITKTSKDGVSAYYLIIAARELGFDSYGVNGNLIDIKKEYLPVIAHVVINKSYQHFVVIYKIDFHKKMLVIMDPSYGLKKVSFDEWQDISTNNYLFFKPKKKIPKLVNKKTIREIISPFLNKYRYLLLVIILLSIIYTIINIITSYNFKLLLDEINIETISNIRKVFYILIIFIVIKKLTNLFRNNLVNYLNHQLDKTLFNDIYSHIINLPYLYYKNRTTGDIITRLNDLSNVKELISHLFITIFIDVILLIFILIILFQINISLTITAIITMFIYLMIMLINNQLVYKKIKNSYKHASNVNSYVIESIEMVDTIKSLSLQNKVCYDVEQKYSRLNDNNYSLTRIINIEEFFKNLVFHIGSLIIIYLGVLQVKEDNLLITSLITYMNLLGYFTEPIKNIIDLNLVYKNARESLRRILELYQVPCEEINYNKKYHLDKLKGNIIVNNLSYSYNGINKVIDNVSFEIKAGEKVLIYGSSGSGKSTIMKLLVKYLQGYQGEIRLDGYNLQSLDLYDIRTKICYVSQKENLFTDSIYNNIVLDREISYETFMDITKLTYVEELVSSKNLNYHYLLEENGFNLSGGERQKIILARTLLQDADIYIFDEALNAIDVNKERIILENIFNLYKDKTIIVVSHRFNNNDLFDKKIVIKGDIKWIKIK